MNTTSRVAIMSMANVLGWLATSLALAAPGASVNYTFSQGGYAEGATVTGTFTGADVDGNGILLYFPNDVDPPPIAHLELIAWSMHFSGNTRSPAFDLTLEDLFGFIFEIGTEGVGDDPAFDPTLDDDLQEGIGAIGDDHFFTTGRGPNRIVGGYVGGAIDVMNNFQAHALDSSTQLLLVTPVPEPASAGMLLAAGLLAAPLGRRRQAR